VMAGCVVLIAAGCVFGQDWPQWRGPNRDDCVSGFATPQTWPTELKQVWKTTVGTGCATPALVGDKLYVFTRQGDEETTLCLNAADGTQVWKDKYTADPVTGPASRHPGPRSSPAVADGKIVTLGVAGVVSCLDTATGKVLWRKDPHLGGQGNGAIIAFDLTSGDEKWRWAGEAPEYASPALLTVDGTKQIVTLSEKSIVSVAVADGKLLWQLPFVPEGRAYNAATPIVDGQTVIYTGAGRGIKAVKVEKQGDTFTTTEIWSNPDLAPQFNTPVLKDDLLFGLTNTGNLFCVNAQNGQTAWTDATARDRQGFSAIVSAGSCLMALPSNSEMLVYKPDGTQYAEIAKIKVADTPTYAHPVLAGNRIFIKDQETVAMLTVQ
jgi:outer membrane protein assembly factor BamB